MTKFDKIDFQKYESVFNRRNYPIINITNNSTIQISRGGPCLCLSGKSYLDCCYLEIQMSNDFKRIYPNDSQVILADFYEIDKYASKTSIPPRTKSVNFELKSRKEELKIKYCSATSIDGENCDQLIKRSHTLSEGNVFKNLSNKQPVYTFNEHAPLELCSIENISLFYIRESVGKKASRYPVFCNHHDDRLFKEIEKGSPNFENSFLEHLEYAIKACSFDVYYKVMQIKYLSEMVSTEPLVFDSEFLWQYLKTIEYLFVFHEYLETLLEIHKNFSSSRKNTELEKRFRYFCLKIPSERVEFSLSEIIPDRETGVNCFVNVLNAPEPILLVSYLDEKNEIEKEWQKWIENIFVNSTNIFFTQDSMNSLSDNEKYLIYLYRKNVPRLANEIASLIRYNETEIEKIILEIFCNIKQA